MAGYLAQGGLPTPSYYNTSGRGVPDVAAFSEVEINASENLLSYAHSGLLLLAECHYRLPGQRAVRGWDQLRRSSLLCRDRID